MKIFFFFFWGSLSLLAHGNVVKIDRNNLVSISYNPVLVTNDNVDFCGKRWSVTSSGYVCEALLCRKDIYLHQIQATLNNGRSVLFDPYCANKSNPPAILDYLTKMLSGILIQNEDGCVLARTCVGSSCSIEYGSRRRPLALLVLEREDQVVYVTHPDWGKCQ